jgi:hypothetical protein
MWASSASADLVVLLVRKRELGRRYFLQLVQELLKFILKREISCVITFVRFLERLLYFFDSIHS